MIIYKLVKIITKLGQFHTFMVELNHKITIIK
jgi:hypothetical protein